MTGGVIVSEKPCPIICVMTVFFAAIARSASSTSASLRAAGRSSGRSVRIEAGTAASMSASSES